MQIPDNILSLPRISLYLEHFALSNNNLLSWTILYLDLKVSIQWNLDFEKKVEWETLLIEKKKIYKDSRVKKF